MTAVTMTLRNSSRDTHSRSGSAYFSNPSRSPSSERPWTHNDDELYEWMDVLITHDVAVQTDFELEEEDCHELVFSPVGAHEDVADHTLLSKSRDAVQTEHVSSGAALSKKPLQSHDIRHASQADASQSWVNKRESLSTMDRRREQSHVGTSADVDPPTSRDRLRCGCSTSTESDAFNNLPLARLTEQPFSPMSEISQEHRRNVSQVPSSFLHRCANRHDVVVGAVGIVGSIVRSGGIDRTLRSVRAGSEELDETCGRSRD